MQYFILILLMAACSHHHDHPQDKPETMAVTEMPESLTSQTQMDKKLEEEFLIEFGITPQPVADVETTISTPSADNTSMPDQQKISVQQPYTNPAKKLKPIAYRPTVPRLQAPNRPYQQYLD